MRKVISNCRRLFGQFGAGASLLLTLGGCMSSTACWHWRSGA
jgi:hypothetical protein